MKRLLAMVVCLSCSSPVFAEWTHVGGTTAATFYVDFGSLKHNGKFREAWDLTNYAQPQTLNKIDFLSIKAKTRFDCTLDKKMTLVILHYSEQMGQGEVVGRYETEAQGKWDYVVPDSIGEEVLRRVCKR